MYKKCNTLEHRIYNIHLITHKSNILQIYDNYKQSLYACSNKCVLSCFLKMLNSLQLLSSKGRLFHRQGAATLKALSPNLELDFGMTSECLLRVQRKRPGEYGVNISLIYTGARLWRTLKTSTLIWYALLSSVKRFM